MASTTKQLLKDKLLQGTDAGAEEATGETKINVSEMTVKELDAFVKKHGVQIDGWAKMKLLAKRTALAEYLEKIAAAAEVGDDAAAGLHEDGAAPEPPDADLVDAESAVTGSALVHPTMEVLGPDPMANLVDEIKALDESTAHAMVDTLFEASEAAEFKLGGVLLRIFEEGWHKGHSTFKEYVHDEHGIHYRKARYLMNIYKTLVDKQVPWEAVSKVGWAKMKELLPVIDADNAESWAKAAESMTVSNLSEYVKSYKAGDGGKKADPAPDSSDTQKVKTVQLKLQGDQIDTFEEALEKAKEASGTEYITAAVDFILVEYLGQPAKEFPVFTDKASIVKILKKLLAEHDGDEHTALTAFFEAFDEVFPHLSVQIAQAGAEEGENESAA